MLTKILVIYEIIYWVLEFFKKADNFSLIFNDKGNECGIKF